MFQARHLTKRYGRLTALSDVSFSVRLGEVLGLIGPNGSAKTTLFECLGGVLPLDAGSLVHDGRPMSDRARASTLFYLPDSIVACCCGRHSPHVSQPVVVESMAGYARWSC